MAALAAVYASQPAIVMEMDREAEQRLPLHGVILHLARGAVAEVAGRALDRVGRLHTTPAGSGQE